MKVLIMRATCPTVVEREFVLQGPVTYVDKDVIEVEVCEFRCFLSRLYRAYCSLSRQSYGDAMRCTIQCTVRNHAFFVKVEDGGLRYGEL